MVKYRNQKIVSLSSRYSITDLSKKFKLSEARIWQIINQEPNYCLRHSKYFLKFCPYCAIEEEYQRIYLKAKIHDLVTIGKELSKMGRQKEAVLKKRIFTRIMKNHHGYSFSSIGRLLKMDHTSAMNLYYNN